MEELLRRRLTLHSAPQSAPQSFLSYLPLVSPRAWHFTRLHKLVSEHLDAVTRGELKRLAIFWPPRHSKTETVTIRYPVYRLEYDPTFRALITGYNERIARRFSRKARTIAKERFPLAADKSGTDEWETLQGGGLLARGVGTPPTGVGFDLILIDDPIKSREEAESETYREKLWDWYTDDLYTRLEPGGAIILTLTRWHHDDLAARALASENWTVLTLPALAEASDPLNRVIGEPLWPERYDKTALEAIKKVTVGFESLYQQNPTPREGAFFKVSQLKVVEQLPADLNPICRAWDLAATTNGGDHTAGIKIGRASDGVFYICDVTRGQWLSDDVEKVLLQTAAMDGRQTLIELPQDPGQAGKGQAQRLIKLLAGYPVNAQPVSGAKEARAFSFAAQVNAGNVRLLKASWNKDFIEELRQFPQGKYDDQVDAASDAFNRLTAGGVGVFI